MPTQPHIQRLVCQELAEAMSAYTWPGNIPTIAAVRRRKAEFGSANEIGSLMVSVVPGPFSTKPNTRSDDIFEVMTGIVIAKLVASDQEVDDLEDLNQAIVDAIRSDRLDLTALPAGSEWSEIEVPVTFDPDALAERSMFLSQTVVTWQIPLNRITATP